MKVKLLDTYEKDAPKYFYRTRHLRLENHGVTFETPLRALNNTDFNAKAMAPSTAILKSPVSGVFKNLNSGEVEDLLTTNAASTKMIASIEAFSHKMQYSDIVFASIQPPGTAIETILASDRAKEKFLRLVFRIQKEAGLKVISVPWLRLSTEKTLEEYRRIDRESYEEPMFFLDCEADPRQLKEISEYLATLVDTERIHLIGARYIPVRRALTSYDTLWEAFREKNVALVLSNAPRFEPDASNLSGVHMGQFVLGDILSTKVSRNRPKNKKEDQDNSDSTDSQRTREDKDLPLDEPDIHTILRFFDRGSLTVNPILGEPPERWTARVLGELDEPQARLALEHYEEAAEDDNKLRALNAFSRVHESVSSEKEFNVSRELIGKGEAEEYIGKKSVLGHELRSTRKRN